MEQALFSHCFILLWTYFLILAWRNPLIACRNFSFNRCFMFKAGAMDKFCSTLPCTALLQTKKGTNLLATKTPL